MADKLEIKEFTTSCPNANGGNTSVTLYLGYPSTGNHPLANQNKALSSRGYSIPEHVMESFQKLAEIAEKNNIPFIDLCDYVIKEVEVGKSVQEDMKKASEISNKEGINLQALNPENTDDKNSNQNQDINNQNLIETASQNPDQSNIQNNPQTPDQTTEQLIEENNSVNNLNLTDNIESNQQNNNTNKNSLLDSAFNQILNNDKK